MRRYTIEIAGKRHVIDVQELAEDEFYVLVGDQRFDVRLAEDQDLAEAVITPEIVPTGAPRPAPYHPPPPETLPPVPRSPQPALPPTPPIQTDGLRSDLTAPMPGTILEINVKPGDAVTRGQTVLVLEAMKMRNSIKSPRDGTVAEVKAQPGQSVGYGDVLLRFEQNT